VLPIFEANFYWGHSENFLPSMAGDPDKAVCQRAVNIILETRHNPLPAQKMPRHGKGSNKRVQIFNVPKPVYDARFYDLMTDLAKEDRFEPPWTRSLSDDQIWQFINKPLVVPIPHHTQYVERAIRVITQLGTAAASNNKREGMALATFKDWAERPRCEMKADFA
jgi:hypothetical protein